MFDEILKLKEVIVRQVVAVFAVACGFFFFGPAQVVIFDQSIMVPVVAPYDSFVAVFLHYMQTDLLPSNIVLIALGPMSAFNTLIGLAFLLAFLITFPYLLYELVRYLSPALQGAERRALLLVLLPAVLLFGSGCIFAWKFVIPATFSALYAYTAVAGIASYFAIDAFASTVIMFMFATGIFFLLPIFMVMLTLLNIIKASFWRQNWRQAVLTFVIVSAIITPDGTGISMMLLAVPLGGLYAVGTGVASMQRTPSRTSHHS